MSKPSANEVTELLLAWNQGDASALDRLMPIVYDELRRLAHRYMSNEREAHVLQTTALVNEAFMRLVDSSRVQWQGRAHFFAVSSQLMRRVLVDVARARGREKRGGDRIQVTLDEGVAGGIQRSADLIALDDALSTLAGMDERAGKVVELRFFGGLENPEIAEALGISVETVKRDWRWARAWLLRELSGAAAPS